MNYKINDIIIGKVTKVRPYALFLTFDNNAEGLLHISEISDKYIKDIEKFASLGDTLKVKVIEIDESNGFLRVSFKKVPQEESLIIRNTNKNNSFKGDFTPLQEHLQEWIDNTLAKMEKKDD